MYKELNVKLSIIIMSIFIFSIPVIAFLIRPLLNNDIILFGLVGLLFVGSILLLLKIVLNEVENLKNWYNGILDYIDQPLSVTDLDMNWTFINKPVEDFLGLKRKDVIGKQCDNWGAKICNTDLCGIYCLRYGKERTFFDQSGGNFKVDTHYLYDRRNKEIGHIEVVTNITSEVSLSELLNEVKSSIKEITIGADQISESSQSLSQGSSQQASSLEEISVSVTELTNQVQSNTEIASQVSQLAGESKNTSEEGNKLMKELVEAMNNINQSASDIKNIVKVIDDIAFQTNLLALNADIEAARVGKYGKGFAVVAGSVRNLALRSSESVKQTTGMVENAINKINLGVSLVEKTAQKLDEITNSSVEVSNLTKNVADSNQEQAKGIEQISTALSSIEDVVQSNSANAEENSASSEELASQSKSLRDFTSSIEVSEYVEERINTLFNNHNSKSVAVYEKE
jgi:PAS domain S-box-containing protein